MRGGPADGVDGAAVDQKVEVGAIGAVRVVVHSADLLARLPPAVLAANHALVKGVTQPGARRRRLGTLRCCVSQKCVSLAEVRISGKCAARSRRERGETCGSARSASSAIPATLMLMFLAPVRGRG